MKHELDCYAFSWVDVIRIVIFHVSLYSTRLPADMVSNTSEKNTRSEPRCVFPRVRLSASDVGDKMSPFRQMFGTFIMSL